MPRRSLRNSGATIPHETKSPASIPSSSKPAESALTKSKYFTATSSSGLDSPPSSPDAAAAEASGYEDEDASVSEPSSVDEVEEEEDEYASEDPEEPRKRQKRGPVARSKPKSSFRGTPVKAVKGQELWRVGVKTGLGPGKQVVIELPKARGPGKISYMDETIHPNTMLFLKELAENNDREWLKMHDPNYRASLKDFNSFVETLQEKLIELDETIPELPTKDIIFRIYRDVRFSPDPTPYKTHFSAAWSRTGRKGPFAAYYVQIKPGGSFVGGGLWMPEAAPLALLRRNIDRKPQKLKRVLLSPGLRTHFLGDIGADEKKAVQAFVGQNTENALRTKPKGFDKNHKEITLLRLRSFTVGTKIPDADVLGKRGLERIVDLFGALVPWITFLNSIVMPDGDDASDDDESAEDIQGEIEEEEEVEEAGEEEEDGEP